MTSLHSHKSTSHFRSSEGGRVSKIVDDFSFALEQQRLRKPTDFDENAPRLLKGTKRWFFASSAYGISILVLGFFSVT
jgi:hypothetical protein